MKKIFSIGLAIFIIALVAMPCALNAESYKDFDLYPISENIWVVRAKTVSYEVVFSSGNAFVNTVDYIESLHKGLIELSKKFIIVEPPNFGLNAGVETSNNNGIAVTKAIFVKVRPKPVKAESSQWENPKK